MAIVSSNKLLISVWLVLLFLCAVSALLAETSSINTISSIFVCFIIALKGQLVIDHLMGLRWANSTIRRVMISYFYILSFLIALGILLPEFIVDMTTLGG